MEEQFEGKIKFYEIEINILFSNKYDKFKNLFGKMFGVTDDFLNSFSLSYKDEDGDIIEIINESDYKLFIEENKKIKKLMILFIKVKEESISLKEKYSNSIIVYASKNKLEYINLSKKNKDINKSLELTGEINPEDIIPLLNNEKEKENKNKNNNQNSYNNILDNNIYNINENININDSINNYKNSNNNINNDINNIIPQKQQAQNPKNKNIHQPHFSQNQNQQSPYQNQENNSVLKNMTSYPCFCAECALEPIYNVIYFCEICKYFLCQKCELKEGPYHRHPFCKAQNLVQYNSLNIEGANEGFGNRIQNAYNSFFGVNNNNINNNNINNNNNLNKNNEQNAKKSKWANLVKTARINYDLGNVTDEQIEQALIKKNGNIDEAVFSLFG